MSVPQRFAPLMLATLLGLMLASVALTAAQEEDRGSLSPLQSRRAATLIIARCTVCHTTDLISQQRLPEDRWTVTVEKMVHWGADLSKEEAALVLRYLVARNHPGAEDNLPTIEQELLMSQSTSHQSAAADGPLTGLPASGSALYAHNCQACHGADAAGGVGPKLAGNMILKHEGAFWETVLHGRGPMPAWGAVLSQQDIADIHAWLATR
ncbi:MAG: c-type cytochrome [Nitrospira sp.]